MVKRLICLIAVFVVLGVAGSAWADLVARYRLDEGQGTTVSDSTGHGYDSVLEGDPTWTDGMNGGAIDLDGDGDYIDLGNPPDWPSGTADRSICTWALTRTVASGFGWIFSYGTNSTSQAMFIGRNGTTLIGGAYADATTVSNWWVADEWHHIALAYDGSMSHLYTDGVQIASQAESWNLMPNYAIIGNQVGYGQSPFAEQTTVHGGKQAMPFIYNNNATSFSETDRTLSPAQDWTAHGFKSLSLFVHGQAGNTGQPYVKINGVRVTDAFVTSALDKPQWTPFIIDPTALEGASLNSVKTLSFGVEGTGSTGTIFLDDIRLYGYERETVEPVVLSDSDPNLAAYYTFDGTVADSKGNYTGVSASTPVYLDGYSGQAMAFNGVNDSVICALAAEEVWSGYTVNLWARTDSFAQTVYSSLFNNNSSSSDFQIDVDGGNPGLYRYRGSATRFFGPVVSEWMNLGVTCDGALTVLYFNGQPVDSAQVADTRFGQIAVGINRAGDAWFEGVIDELRLYNRALTAGEMAGLAGITEAIPKPF